MAENFRFICDGGVLSGAEGAVPEVLTVPGEINGESVCSWGYILERCEQPDYDERRGEVFIRTEVRRVSRPLSGMEGVKHLVLPTGLNNISDDAFSSTAALPTFTPKRRPRRQASIGTTWTASPLYGIKSKELFTYKQKRIGNEYAEFFNFL